MRKGIILAGGAGSRLHPITLGVSKQILPVYNKPMIYYPLATLMLAKIRTVLIISTPHDLPLFKTLLGDGSQWGMELSYAVQAEPNGLAQAFIIGEDFLDECPSALILGDNLFYGNAMRSILAEPCSRNSGASIFAYKVRDPERYGVIEFDEAGNALSIEEKPARPKSPFAVPGFYFYDSRVCEYAKKLKPSPRGELEITDLNKVYLDAGELHVTSFGRGIAWFDTGTYQSLLQAGNFVEAIEERIGYMICCPEEIAFENGWIDAHALQKTSLFEAKNAYGEYLRALISPKDDS